MSVQNNFISRQDAQMPLFIGIDIGGQSIKIGLVDDKGQTLAYGAVPTEADREPDHAVARMSAEIDRLLDHADVNKNDVARIGLASPGPLDLQEGILLTPGNLQAWWNYPLRQRVSDACGLPVRYANDANAAAYGEFWCGAGKKYHSIVMITLGTGVGGGIIVGDTLIEGVNGCGSECGHILIDFGDEAPIDSLEKTGSLEAYCGSYGVVGRAQQEIDAGIRSTLAEVEQLTPLAISQAAEAGDELARRVVMDTARYLGYGIVTLIHTIDPDSVVLGGAMTFGGAGYPLGEEFINHIRASAKPRLIPSLRESLHIDFAQLGGDAGYIGAAGLARLEHSHK